MLLAFASECLVKDAGAVVPDSHLYAAFEAWLSEQGAASWSQRTFRGRIASHGYFRDVKEGTHRWRKLTLSTWGAEAHPRRTRCGATGASASARARTSAALGRLS